MHAYTRNLVPLAASSVYSIIKTIAVQTDTTDSCFKVIHSFFAIAVLNWNWEGGGGIGPHCSLNRTQTSLRIKAWLLEHGIHVLAYTKHALDIAVLSIDTDTGLSRCHMFCSVALAITFFYIFFQTTRI